MLMLIFLIFFKGCDSKLECPGSSGCQDGHCTRKYWMFIVFPFPKYKIMFICFTMINFVYHIFIFYS